MVSDRDALAQLAGAHDVDLAALARGGDRRAFGELVRRHGSAVRGLLRRIGAEPALADQIARDAFLDAFERIAEFRAEIAFQAWVKQIAARAFARRWRLQTPDAERESRSPQLSREAETARDLDGALSDLVPLERICVSLCYGGGLSHADAASALKLPPATVKSHVRRGLDRLRERLAPPPGDGPDDGASRRRPHGRR
jgi:RNA polymerase sigma factor (sigma-70 family)